MSLCVDMNCPGLCQRRMSKPPSCERYSVSGMCHLYEEIDNVDGKDLSERLFNNQYNLFLKEITESEFKELLRRNKVFFNLPEELKMIEYRYTRR